MGYPNSLRRWRHKIGGRPASAIAAVCGVPERTYLYWENSPSVPLSALRVLALHYSCSIDDLVAPDNCDRKSRMRYRPGEARPGVSNASQSTLVEPVECEFRVSKEPVGTLDGEVYYQVTYDPQRQSS